ncbi:MAG: FtsX-like permease family protein [Verrucomicrobia bacterium]|nr:FtsX-like permease family protein [Verrucomicrobiota bacterium]MBI3870844.1 FtsX-like permease family protein [Verrucomicrobiota bacterium]
MTLLRLVWKSLRQHALSTMVTAFSIALATGLWITVWVTKDEAQSTFTSVTAGFDAVLGARGSALQLVLNAVFHLESSPGNLPFGDVEDIRKDARVKFAVPIAVGDNFQGYRLVGTLPDFFDHAQDSRGRAFRVKPGGRMFDPLRREAVLGSFVARRLGMKIGDSFHPYHGLLFNENDRHAETYLVVGVLEPSNTPADRVLWIPLSGIQSMGGHDPKTANDVSAVLVKLNTALAGHQMEQMYNKQGNRLTFAWPIGRIVAQLFDKVAWFEKVLGLVAYLVALVAAGSVLASIYNSMNERRREIAILRALGARRRTIFSAVVLEALMITLIGVAVGGVLYLALMQGVSGIVRAQTGVVLNPWQAAPVMLWAPAAMLALGALAGVVPAVKAYRTDVAANLSPTS